MNKKYLIGIEVIPYEELEVWSTPRLLRYYKSARKFTVGRSRNYYYEDTREYKEFPLLVKYVETIKSMLDKQEHVSRKTK